jgi:hypothetical protein
VYEEGTISDWRVVKHREDRNKGSDYTLIHVFLDTAIGGGSYLIVLLWCLFVRDMYKAKAAVVQSVPLLKAYKQQQNETMLDKCWGE